MHAKISGQVLSITGSTTGHGVNSVAHVLLWKTPNMLQQHAIMVRNHGFR